MSSQEFFMPYYCEICNQNNPFNTCFLCKKWMCIKCIKFKDYCTTCSLNEESYLIIIENNNKKKYKKYNFFKKYLFFCTNKIKPI
jgi:hypothetical protein